MVEMNKIRLGLPKGSLNNLSRGNTKKILVAAGYTIAGYEPGIESDNKLDILNDSHIAPFLTRPQSAPLELRLGLIDIAIIGDDWVQEDAASGGERDIRRIGNLGYGAARLVFALPADCPYESLSEFFEAQEGRTTPILCFTEYVQLTRKKLMCNPAYKKKFGNKKPVVKVRGLTDGENGLVQIINSDGITEGYIRKGADIISDITVSGDTLRAYGLRELETIMESRAGLYAGPSCTGWKEKKAIEIRNRTCVYE